MAQYLKKNIVTWSIWLILIINIFVLFHLSYYKSAVSSGDSAGYYSYLPAYFIEHDFEFIRQIIGQGEDYSGQQTGAFVNKYTCGVAILQSPFFAIAHFAAHISGQPTDGYSPPYILALVASILFYTTLGIVLLSKVLKKYFAPEVVATVLIIIGLATNLFYFTTMNNQMSHGYLFFLYALLIYSTEKWYASPTWKMAIFIGLSAGLITLIRPSDILVLSIPLFYGLTNWNKVKERFSFLRKHWAMILVAILFFALAAVPQLMYWKVVTGDWLYYSYRDEGFDFRHPHIIAGITDGKNGWLRYTPVMLFSLIGIGFLFKKRTWLWPILLFLPLYMFIVYSWHVWFYINSFGSRPMVGPYALLAIPLAYFVQYAFAKKWLKEGILVLVIFFSILNIFQTYQEYWGVSRSEYASDAYYWKIFGKTKMDYSMLATYDSNVNQPRYTHYISTIYENSFNDTAQAHLDFNTFHSPPAALRMNKEFGEITLLSKTVAELGVKPKQYLKISGWFYAEHPVSWWSSALMIGSVIKNGKTTRWRQMWINNKILAEESNFSLRSSHPKEWGEVYFYYKIPSNTNPQDKIQLLIQNGHSTTIIVDDLKVEVSERLK